MKELLLKDDEVNELIEVLKDIVSEYEKVLKERDSGEIELISKKIISLY